MEVEEWKDRRRKEVLTVPRSSSGWPARVLCGISSSVNMQQEEESTRPRREFAVSRHKLLTNPSHSSKGGLICSRKADGATPLAARVRHSPN